MLASLSTWPPVPMLWLLLPGPALGCLADSRHESSHSAHRWCPSPHRASRASSAHVPCYDDTRTRPESSTALLRHPAGHHESGRRSGASQRRPTDMGRSPRQPEAPAPAGRSVGPASSGQPRRDTLDTSVGSGGPPRQPGSVVTREHPGTARRSHAPRLTTTSCYRRIQQQCQDRRALRRRPLQSPSQLFRPDRRPSEAVHAEGKP